MRDKLVIVSKVLLSLYTTHVKILDYYCFMSVHDNIIIGNELSDSEDDIMQERLRQLARQRDERRLQHITQMNKIAEEQETQDQQTAQARVDIKKQKEAADLEDVSYSFFLYYL